MPTPKPTAFMDHDAPGGTDRPLVAIPKHIRVLLSSANGMHQLSYDLNQQNLVRREIPNWLADRIHGFDGDILFADATPFVVGDDHIDLAFNDDASFRWLSDFAKFQGVPPRQKPQERVLYRLLLIYVALNIERNFMHGGTRMLVGEPFTGLHYQWCKNENGRIGAHAWTNWPRHNLVPIGWDEIKPGELPFWDGEQVFRRAGLKPK